MNNRRRSALKTPTLMKRSMAYVHVCVGDKVAGQGPSGFLEGFLKKIEIWGERGEGTRVQNQNSLYPLKRYLKNRFLLIINVLIINCCIISNANKTPSISAIHIGHRLTCSVNTGINR